MKITSKRGGTVRIPHPETGEHVIINQGENDIPNHVWSQISSHKTVKGLLQTGEIHLGPAKKAAAIVPAPPDDEDYDDEEGDEQERGGTPAGVMDEIRRKEQRDADAAYEKKQAEADAKAAAEKAEADKKSHSKKK